MPCAHASYSETGRDRMQIKCDKWMQFLLQPLTLSYGCEKFTSSFKSTLVCSEILSPKQYMSIMTVRCYYLTSPMSGSRKYYQGVRGVYMFAGKGVDVWVRGTFTVNFSSDPHPHPL